MKFKKLIASILLIAILTMNVINLQVFAQEYNGFEYRYTVDNTIEITKYLGNEQIINIPQEIDGTIVTSIGEEAFYSFQELYEIYLPESIENIGARAFYNCSDLLQITLPSNLKTIKEEAFCASGIKAIEIPESVVDIAESAFSYSDIESVKINANLEVIKKDAFLNCVDLVEVELPSSLKTIERRAFMRNSKLQNVIFGDKSELTSIGENAFYHCSELNEINLPNTVNNIGDGAFGLSPTTLVAESNSYIQQYAKDNNMKLVLVDDSSEFEFKYKEDGTLEITDYLGTDAKVVIPSQINGATVISIGNSAFFNDDFLEEVTIPVSVVVIDDSAFARCDILKVVRIEETDGIGGLITIETGAFTQCPQLTEINLPKTITSIQNYAFDEFNIDNNLTVYTYKDAEEVIRYMTERQVTSEIIFLDKNDLADVNADGDINMQDILLILDYLSGHSLNEEAILRAEVTGDGDVNMQDILRILDYLAGTITEF